MAPTLWLRILLPDSGESHPQSMNVGRPWPLSPGRAQVGVLGLHQDLTLASQSFPASLLLFFYCQEAEALGYILYIQPPRICLCTS